MFITHRRPGPGKVVSPRDVCPDTGLARLSYGQARALLDEPEAIAELTSLFPRRQQQVRILRLAVCHWMADGLCGP